MNKNEATIWLFLRKMRVPLIVLNIFHAIPVVLLTLVPGVDAEGNTVYLGVFDAMYIVAYTITTIGFGEIPYAFTYPQRLVVFLTIYGTVPAWVFSIGYMISLFQDKTFVNAVKMNNFRRRVKKLGQDFIIICGYNNISKILIEKLLEDKIYRVVVVDKNPQKIEELEMESYTPVVPAIVADASQTDILKAAGITLTNCKFLVTIFDDDQLNLKTSVRARILNSEIRIVAKAGIKQGVENLQNIGVDHVVDPFEIIANRINIAYRSPYLFNILNWINGGNLHLSKNDILPRGRHIVCSGGRFGVALKKVLEANGIECEFVNINKTTQEKEASDMEFLLNAGLKSAECIVAGTNDDAINLSIISTARAIKPDIFTIVRENELEEKSMFSHLRVQKIFILDRIAAINAYNFIDRPLSFMFMDALAKKTNEEIEDFLGELIEKTNKRPILINITIEPKKAFAVCEFLKEQKITLSQLLENPFNNAKDIDIVVLAIKRENGEFDIFPTLDKELLVGDIMLIAGTSSSLDKFDMILNNHNELYFVLNKKEIKHFVFEKISSVFN